MVKGIENIVRSSLLLILVLILSAQAEAAPKSKNEIKQDVAAKDTPSVRANPAQANGMAVQRDLMQALVQTFSWQGGLPKEPRDADYQEILRGRRIFRFEAEAQYASERDNVTLRAFNLYGPFSGTGWLSGVATPEMVHFQVFIPLDGEYTLTVTSKGDGQRWYAGGAEFTVDAGGRLREVRAGKIFLKAGTQEINVQLPAEGAVDCFTLAAPPLRPVEPLQGWEPSAPLRLSDLAEVAAVLLGTEEALPASGDQVNIEAARSARIPSSASVTFASYLGAFKGSGWVRAGGSVARVEIPINIGKTGVYAIAVNALAEELKLELDGEQIVLKGKPYLDWLDLGTRRLTAGRHILLLDLPPGGGVDMLKIEQRNTRSADYLAVSGLKGDVSSQLTLAEMKRQLSAIASRFKARR